MKNLVIEKRYSFREDSCIRIAGTVEIDNVKHNFDLKTDEMGAKYVDGIDKELVPQLVAILLEDDPDLDCYLED